MALSQDFSKAALQAVTTGAPDEESSCRSLAALWDPLHLEPLATRSYVLGMLYYGIRRDIIVPDFLHVFVQSNVQSNLNQDLNGINITQIESRLGVGASLISRKRRVGEWWKTTHTMVLCSYRRELNAFFANNLRL